jgi:hypothetical protein
MSGNDYEVYLGFRRHVLSELSLDYVMEELGIIEFKVIGGTHLSVIISAEDATMLTLLHGCVDDFLIDAVDWAMKENRQYVGYGYEW